MASAPVPKRKSAAYGSLRSQGRLVDTHMKTPYAIALPARGERADRVRSTALDSIFKQPNHRRFLRPSLRANGSRECAPRWFAMTWNSRHGFELQTRVRGLAAQCARAFDKSLAQRGRGECRMPNAPAASCAMIVVERTRVTTSTPESPGIPARNGFNGFLRALPGDRALLQPKF